jgi:hypothetical protein
MHHQVPQRPPLTPRQVLLQLLIGELSNGPNRCCQHRIVLLRQPAGFSGQIDLDVQVQRGYELFGVKADDDLVIIDNRHG